MQEEHRTKPRQVLFRATIALSVLSLLVLGSISGWLFYKAGKAHHHGVYFSDRLTEVAMNWDSPKGKISREGGFFDEKWVRESEKTRDESFAEATALRQSAEILMILAATVPTGLWVLLLVLNWVLFGRLSFRTAAKASTGGAE